MAPPVEFIPSTVLEPLYHATSTDIKQQAKTTATIMINTIKPGVLYHGVGVGHLGHIGQIGQGAHSFGGHVTGGGHVGHAGHGFGTDSDSGAGGR